MERAERDDRANLDLWLDREKRSYEIRIGKRVMLRGSERDFQRNRETARELVELVELAIIELELGYFGEIID